MRHRLNLKSLVCGVLWGAAAGAAPAWGASGTDAALRECRAHADTARRLACYDAIALPSGPSAAAPSSAAAPVARGGPARPDDAFGLEDRRPPGAVDEIHSQIVGRFEGWGPGTRFTLANGQVWQVSDSSHGVYSLQAPKVTVRRASMGTFMLEIDGAGRSPRVRRVDESGRGGLR